MQSASTEAYVAEILHCCYEVRYYWRGGHTSIGRLRRQQAILKLALVLRQALSECDDHEALLAAVVDGLRPRGEQSF